MSLKLGSYEAADVKSRSIMRHILCELGDPLSFIVICHPQQ